MSYDMEIRTRDLELKCSKQLENAKLSNGKKYRMNNKKNEDVTSTQIAQYESRRPRVNIIQICFKIICTDFCTKSQKGQRLAEMLPPKEIT